MLNSELEVCGPALSNCATAKRQHADSAGFVGSDRQPDGSDGASTYLSSFEFTTKSMLPADQFGSWRQNFAPILDLETSCDVTDGFTGRQTIWDLGCFAFSEFTADAFEFRSVSGHVGEDKVDHFVISVLLSGRAYTAAPSRTFHGGAGVAQVHSLGRSFHGNVSDCELLTLFVPRDFCPQVTLALGAAEFTILDSGMGRLFHDYMIGLAKQLPTVESVELPALAAATRAMILACVSPSADHLEMAANPIATTLLGRAHEYVQSRLFDSTLGARSLGRELGVSRSRLYRMFEPFGGVNHYIQRRRLLDAHAALANPNDQRRILDIAEERCFPDGTEFSRAFKREFGYSPTEVRSGQRLNVSRIQGSGLRQLEPKDRFGTILRRLQG
jgi:AraC-like DNA-binding protein